MKDIEFHPAPLWLTKDYLEKVLRKNMNDDKLTIENLEICPATGKGENFASVMTRVRIEYRLSNKKNVDIVSYIVKTTFENDPVVAAIMSKYDIYNTEMLMYEKILPELTQLLKEIGDEEKLFADTIHVDYEHVAIIFEDLAVRQYVCADRVEGMDEIYMKMALKKLAKMHATAAVYNERHPGLLPKLDHGMFNRYTRGFSNFFESMIGVCAEYAGTCDELGVYYKEKLLKLREQVIEYATRVFDRKEGHFLTLTHGDMWINNMMLRYDNDANGRRSIKDILLIDFQFAVWASPAVDLHYFYNTSLQHDLRMHKQEEFNQYYYNILKETLQKLNYAGRIPSLREFCIQLEEGRFYAVSSALVVQPNMINDKTEDSDINSLLGNDERAKNFRNLLYTNKPTQRHVKDLLPIFDRRGLLDVTD